MTQEKITLKLYIIGHTAKSEIAITNLRKICREDLQDQYEIKIIDLLENPQIAEDDGIVAFPTLIKELPSSLIRIIGDLSDKEKILLGLDLQLK